MTSQLVVNDVIANIFYISVFLFSGLVTGPGSGVTTIFVYKGLTRNPEMRNTSVSVLPNI